MLKKFKKLLGRGGGGGSGPGLYEGDRGGKAGRGQIARLPTKYFTSSSKKMVSAAETYGLIRLTVLEAELDSIAKGKEYFAVVSVGTQSLSTKCTSAARPSSSGAGGSSAEQLQQQRSGSETGGAQQDKGKGASEKDLQAKAEGEVEGQEVAAREESKASSSPEKGAAQGRLLWNASSNFVLQKHGATVAQVSVYRRGRLDGAFKNHLLGWCTVDLATYFEEEEEGEGVSDGAGDDLVDGWFELVDPSESSCKVGRIRLSGQVSSLKDLETQMWRRLLPIADNNGDGTLELGEFSTLLQAFGCELPAEEIEGLFREADKDSSGTVNADELADMLASHHRAGDFYKLMKRCPIDGAELTPSDDYANLIYIHLAMDEGTGQSLKGGYATEAQASRAWMLRMSEWVTQPLAGAPGAFFKGNRYKAGGLRTGASAAHILVFDRDTKRVEEERIDPVLVLAMRNMYQSSVGRLMLNSGLYAKLRTMSENKGKYMDSPESIKEIEPFLRVFRGQIKLDDMAQPLSSFKNFNEFFYRKLKPEARPIADPEEPHVLISAADCRLMVFHTVDEATRCWIKGKQFSLAGLLADAAPGHPLAAQFAGGSMGIFRLAPQDYHRFHAPCAGTVASITDVPGQLYTVNPIAVNSRFANVFTENKRSVLILDSPEFGRVAYIAIGATMVGSIIWTAAVGQAVAKGEELGYFAFGGSTVVVLFAPGKACWDEDLVQNSLKSLETKVRMGERLGVLKGSALEPEQAAKEAMAADAKAQTEGVVPLDERPDMAEMLAAGGDSSPSLPRP